MDYKKSESGEQERKPEAECGKQKRNTESGTQSISIIGKRKIEAECGKRNRKERKRRVKAEAEANSGRKEQKQRAEADSGSKERK